MFNTHRRAIDQYGFAALKAGILFAFLLLWIWPVHADDDFLAPEQAFKLSVKMTDVKTVEISYAIADGYYMYREHFQFSADGATLGAPVFPPGKIKFDENFQKNVETYRHAIVVKLPIEADHPFTLNITGQGCADKGLCYPPMLSAVVLSPAGVGMTGNIPVTVHDETGPARTTPSVVLHASSDAGRIESALQGRKLLVILPLFLLLGLGLSFTPCVLPLVPILSSIIVGEGTQVGRRRGFTLSVTYAFGMAVVYTALGIAAGLIGEGLSAGLQNPWVLTAFSLLMVVLSLSMFDVYQLQVPSFIQTRLTQASDRQATGKLIGVFVMGALSALIVGPCVAAPLASALVYLSQTHDILIGGSALFAMAMGMSVPLLLVGLSAGALLPRAGIWMVAVKRFFGVLMLALALWMVSPVLPAIAQMLGWAGLGIAYGGFLLWSKRSDWAARTLGILFALLGIVQLAGVSTGGRDALAPLAHLTGNATRQTEFTRVQSLADLDAALMHANGKAALLDFYADWCVSCKEMEKLTFPDSRIQEKFSGMVLLQVDVTANNDDDKALLKRFHLFGPPGIIFFDKTGQEIEGGRVIGYQNAVTFNQSLGRISH
jgi:thiol:disulfide interchange protein DsbD